MIVPNSHSTRALRKPELGGQDESLSKKVEHKVVGLILEGVITISNRLKVEFYKCLLLLVVIYCESVIFMEFSLQK